MNRGRHAFVRPGEQAGSAVIAVAMLSTFSPVKVYPFLFLFAALYLLASRPYFHRMWWVLWLGAYVGYAILLTLLFSGLRLSALSAKVPLAPDELANLAKLLVNCLFLVAVVNWTETTRGIVLRRHLDLMLFLAFAMTLLQLAFYLAHSGFDKLGAAESSFAASYLYDPGLCFWGVADKNIFGAKIALFGFLFLFNYFIWEHSIPVWRTILVMLCAFLSNSRTPLAALFIGIVYALFRHLRVGGRVLLSLGVAAALPLALARLFRFDNILDASDGMGVRIVYWSTFFSKCSGLPWTGKGFMSGAAFLKEYSPIYLGEPHLHNLFLNNYLDFGVPGSLAYALFLSCFYKFCKRNPVAGVSWCWSAAFLPLLAIMLTLSAGYESDTAVYLAAIYIIGRCASTRGTARRKSAACAPHRFPLKQLAARVSVAAI